ncbi:MAG TPA: TonB-dependent receptor [Longimicrobiales bacterium]|nr:TonB-dependent receptor [Longimicrobiales bacterium]
MPLFKRFTSLLFLLAAALPAAAQTGSIVGTVTSATGEPLSASHVRVWNAAGARLAETLTGDGGRFIVTGIAPGTYSLTVDIIGHEQGRREGVTVTAGGTATVNFTLSEQAFQLGGIVVSASKREEKVLEAPATVAIVDTRAIEEQAALSPVEHLRDVPGVDIIQQGVQSSNVVARGFNNVFSGSLHTLTDYRIASIPSLRVNLLHFIPSVNEDIERMEVVLGPGSALYGPNTANGVLHILTKSPFDDPGTTVTVAGGMRANQSGDAFSQRYDRGLGERTAFQTTFRTAHVMGDEEQIGIKLSGQFLEANEWIYEDPEEQRERIQRLPFDPDTKVGLRDYAIRRYSAEARADWRIDDETTAILTAGTTLAAKAIELTGLGGGMADNWMNSFVQLRGSRDRLFGQVYYNFSNAGDTYLLRTGMPIVDESRMLVGQLQHGADWRATTLTYGVDALYTMPETGGTIHGEFEDEDNVSEIGAYLQAETALSTKLNLVLAGRLDRHSHVDHLVFSPRAALVFQPIQEQNFRLTYNRAFSNPSTLNLFLDLSGGPAPFPLSVLGYHIRAQGTGDDGYDFMNGGQLTGMRSPYAAAVGGTPSDLLAVGTGTLWDLVLRGAFQLGQISAAQYAQLQTLDPGDDDVGIDVRDLTTQQVLRLDDLPESFFEFPSIDESLTQTFEVGYKGILGQRLLLAADAWYEYKTNFVSPLIPVTPLLQLNPDDLEAWLEQQFTAAGDPNASANAAALRGLGGLPAAVVSSADVNSPTDANLLVTYQNFGEVDLWGADLSATALVSDHWQLGLAGSLVSNDWFCVGADGELAESECTAGGGMGRIVALNAPDSKLSARANYRNDDLGLSGELRGRYTSAFPANSAAFVGTDCILGGSSAGTGDCVAQYTILDLNLGYKFGNTGLSTQLSITNLFSCGGPDGGCGFNQPYRSFVGVPEIGTFALLRFRYDL